MLNECVYVGTGAQQNQAANLLIDRGRQPPEAFEEARGRDILPPLPSSSEATSCQSMRKLPDAAQRLPEPAQRLPEAVRGCQAGTPK